jgi:hypothetical protein
MPETYYIHQQPTYDLEEVNLDGVDTENQLAYLSSTKIFSFDGVFGNLENRSRVLRLGKPENKYVVQIISATIDAGFCGYLVWKMQLTQEGLQLINGLDDLAQANQYFTGCQQIHLFPSPATNYYCGSNQTNLQPDVIFTL